LSAELACHGPGRSGQDPLTFRVAEVWNDRPLPDHFQQPMSSL
jgi:hypothetical protein